MSDLDLIYLATEDLRESVRLLFARQAADRAAILALFEAIRRSDKGSGVDLLGVEALLWGIADRRSDHVFSREIRELANDIWATRDASARDFPKTHAAVERFFETTDVEWPTRSGKGV